MNIVMSSIGTENDSPVNNAKGAACNAGLNDFSLLKNFVAIIKTINGKKVLMMACGNAVQNANCEANA